MDTNPIVGCKRDDERTSAFVQFLEIDFGQIAPSVCLAIVRGENPIPSYERLQLDDLASEEFRKSVVSQQKYWKSELQRGNLVVCDYGISSKPDEHELECLDLRENLHISNQVKNLFPCRSIDVVGSMEKIIPFVRFYAVTFESDKFQPISAFRIYSSKKELHQSTKFAAFFRSGTLETVRDPVFLFDRYVDCVRFGDCLYIVRKGNTHKLFRFYEKVVAASEESAKSIMGRIPFTNAPDFIDACKSNTQLATKLYEISNNPSFGTITIDGLKQRAEEYGLDVKFATNGNALQLIWEPAQRWDILRLLNDDFLGSSMTNRKYVVTSKRENKPRLSGGQASGGVPTN